MGKDKKKKSKESNETYLTTTNKYVESNKISEERVKDQIDKGPDPNDRRDSSYPHEFQDYGNLFYPKGKLEDRKLTRQYVPEDEWSQSSTTSLREYPVTQSGDPYKFEPQGRPWPFPRNQQSKQKI